MLIVPFEKKENTGKKKRQRVWGPGGPVDEADLYGSNATIKDFSELSYEVILKN